jgi:short-subunit dehydrogenase
MVIRTTQTEGAVVERRRIVLLGATGYTGQRVLRELLARGEEPALIGRNRTKMQALADHFEVDLPVAEVDVTSTADLAQLGARGTTERKVPARSDRCGRQRCSGRSARRPAV